MLPDIELLKRQLSYEKLLESFCVFFNAAYGEIKSSEIIYNVSRSNKAKRFLADSLYRCQRYSAMSFVSTIQLGRRFLFKKSEIVAFASVALLEKWRVEVGERTDLSNEKYLKQIFFEILFECKKRKTHITNPSDFFC